MASSEAIYILTSLGTFAGAAGAALVGGRRGARRELNGTATAVRRIESNVEGLKAHLADHMEVTRESFDAVHQEFAEIRVASVDTRERTARIEGYLEHPSVTPRRKTR